MKTKYVVLCDQCQGWGTISSEELIDYHKREYATTVKGCTLCEGSGRRIETSEKLLNKFVTPEIGRFG